MSHRGLPPSSAVRILLVEDEVDVREVLGEILKLEGYQVDEAEGAHAAIEKIRAQAAENHEYDLIISDVRMPKGSAKELLTWINSNMETRPPVILVSGNSEVLEYLTCLLGTSQFLVKPFPPDKLISAVKKSLLGTYAKAN